MNKGKLRIVVFSGCSDCPGIWAGGTLLKLVRQGHEVHEVLLSRGASGHPTLPYEEYVKIKEKEDRAVAEIIGFRSVRFLELAQEGEIPYNVENVRLVADLIREYKPDVVINPWPEVKHMDLRMGSELVRNACYMAAKGGVKTKHPTHYIYMVYEFPCDMVTLSKPFEPEIYVDVSDVWETKLKILRQFGSFWGNKKHFWTKNRDVWIRQKEGYFRMFGTYSGVEYAEGFKQYWNMRFKERAFSSLPLPPFGNIETL